MGRKFGSIVATTLAVAGLSLTGAMPAVAAEPDVENTSCWVDGVTYESLCVAEGVDLVAAVRDEFGVQISAPEGTVIAGVPFEQPDAAARSDVGILATVVGILYDDINYGGGTLVFTGIPEGCTTGYAYGYASLSSVGWNDRASSMRGYQGCRTAVWENENYIGASFGYTPGTYHLGAMNDKASSWRLAP